MNPRSKFLIFITFSSGLLRLTFDFYSAVKLIILPSQSDVVSSCWQRLPFQNNSHQSQSSGRKFIKTDHCSITCSIPFQLIVLPFWNNYLNRRVPCDCKFYLKAKTTSPRIHISNSFCHEKSEASVGVATLIVYTRDRIHNCHYVFSVSSQGFVESIIISINSSHQMNIEPRIPLQSWIRRWLNQLIPMKWGSK